MDGDGTFRRFRYDLPYNEYPMVDMLVYRVIRAKIVEIRNEEIKASIDKAKNVRRR